MKLKTLLLALVVVLIGSSMAFAASATFNISASIPDAVDVRFTTSRVVNGPPISFTVIGTGSQALDFGTLEWKSGPGLFLPNHYFAIDVGAVDVAGNPAPGNYTFTTMSYSEGELPPGATIGLGKRGTLSAVKVTGATGSQTETTISNRFLVDVSAATAPTPAQYAGGFLRLYVGIYSGSPVINSATPGVGPFTTADVSGDYTGTLSLTATLL